MGAGQVTVSCREGCGEVKVWATGVALLVSPDDSGWYTFRCPECRVSQTVPAAASTVRLLRSIRVAESKILPNRSTSPALTEDDLIAFGRSIEGNGDPWAELGGTISSPRS